LSAARRSQASVLGALFFLIVLLMSLATIELVVSSLRESLEGVVKALREDASNDERLEVAITDYYAAQPSYATSVTIVKGTYVSGTLASLREVDGDCYVVESPPLGVGGMPVELIENGDFETGSLAPWVVNYVGSRWLIEYGVTQTDLNYSAYCHAKRRSLLASLQAWVNFNQSFTVSGAVDEAQLSFVFKLTFVSGAASAYVDIYIDGTLIRSLGPYSTDTTWVSVSEDVTSALGPGTHELCISFRFASGAFSFPEVYGYLDQVSLRALVKTVAGICEVLIASSFSPPQNLGTLLNVSGYLDMGDPVEVQVIDGGKVVGDFVVVAQDFAFAANVTGTSIALRFASASQFTVHLDMLRMEALVPSSSFNVTITCLSEHACVLRVWYVSRDLHDYVPVERALAFGESVEVTVPHPYGEGVRVYVTTASGERHEARPPS